MTGYTPGPWELEFGHQQKGNGLPYWQVHDGSDAIACNQFCWASNAEANARLIATAPELLEALEGLLEAAETGSERSSPPGYYDEQINAARAAIKKAKGE